MSEDPRLLWITFRMVTRVAVVANLVALVGYVTRRATLPFVLEDGNRMVGFVPALRMWQFDAMARGAEVRLDMACRARLAAFAGDDVGVGGGPGIALDTFGMVACVAVAASFADLRRPVTTNAAGFSGFLERTGVLVLVPTIRVGHLETVAGIAELLLLVAGRTRGIRIGQADAVSAGPIGFDMAWWPRNHGKRVARRARKGGSRVHPMAVETPFHGRFDSHVVDMGLNHVAGTATDGIGHCVVLGMVEDQRSGTVTRPDLIEIQMALRTADEFRVADDRGRWRR